MNTLQHDRRRYAGIRTIRELDRERRQLSVRIHDREQRIGFGIRRVVDHYSPARMLRSALTSVTSGSLMFQFLSRMLRYRGKNRTAYTRTTEKQTGKQSYENI